MINTLNIFNKHEKKIYLIFCVFLWIYICLRAIYVPIIHDEAGTFFGFVQSKNFIPFYAIKDANNHILNSALSTLTYILFGNNEFVLRLPNLIFFIFYLFFIYKLAWLIKNSIIKWSFILTMLFSHYFIEFFGFCRGYGLSMTLIIMSLWFFYIYLRVNKSINLILNLFLLFLAVSANLTLQITAIIINAILLINIFFEKIPLKKRILQLTIIIVLGIFPLIIFTKLLFSMKTWGALYYGDQAGFLSVTLKSLLIAFIDNSSTILTFFVIILFILISFIISFLLLKTSFFKTIKSVGFLSFVMLSGNIIASIFLNKFFEINFPEDRVGLYYFPLFFLSLFFTLDKLFINYPKKYIYLLCLTAFFFPFQFVKEMNLEHVRFWKNYQIPYSFYQNTFSSDDKDFKDFPPIISGYHLHQLCWYYYNNKNGGNNSIMQSNDFPLKDADFLIASKVNFPDMFNYYDSVDYYDYNKLYLLKRKVILKKKLIDSVNINTNGMQNFEFFNIWSTNDISNYKNKSVYFLYNFTINSEENPFDARIIVTSEDKESNKLRYDFLCLDWLKKDWNGSENNFRNCMMVYRLPENSNLLCTYIWNLKKTPFSITDGKCYIYYLD